MANVSLPDKLGLYAANWTKPFPGGPKKIAAWGIDRGFCNRLDHCRVLCLFPERSFSSWGDLAQFLVVNEEAWTSIWKYLMYSNKEHGLTEEDWKSIDKLVTKSMNNVSAFEQLLDLINDDLWEMILIFDDNPVVTFVKKFTSIDEECSSDT